MTPYTPDLLATIVECARRITAVRQGTVGLDTLERAAAARPRRPDAFAIALRETPTPRVIAECKRRSPSRGILRADYEPARHARQYVAGGAAAISVLTEPTFFDGAMAHLEAVRAAVDVPLLRKDFIVSRYQVAEAAAAGADAVLLIVGALHQDELADLIGYARQLGLAALVEAHDAREMERAVASGAEIVGLNSRNLRTLQVDPAVHDTLAALIPAQVTAVAESGLRTSADLRRLEFAGYHAFLVGERLIAEADPGAALRTLREGGQ